MERPINILTVILIHLIYHLIKLLRLTNINSDHLSSYAETQDDLWFDRRTLELPY